VGLKYFYMPMAGIGFSGCTLVGELLKSNRTALELDISFCRIPVAGVAPIANGLRENDVLQVLKVTLSRCSITIILYDSLDKKS
jgi:hypothetical protein